MYFKIQIPRLMQEGR